MSRPFEALTARHQDLFDTFLRLEEVAPQGAKVRRKPSALSDRNPRAPPIDLCHPTVLASTVPNCIGIDCDVILKACIQRAWWQVDVQALPRARQRCEMRMNSGVVGEATKPRP